MREAFVLDDVLQFLDRLRRALIVTFCCWLGGFLLLLAFAERIFHWFSAPALAALPKGQALVFLTPLEPFFTYLWMCAILALVMVLPIIFWQLWRLLVPLFPAGRQSGAAAFVLVGYAGFLTGAWLGFRFAFPTIVKVLLAMGDGGDLAAMLSMGDYLSLALTMLLAFGMVFELPVAMVLLARLGLADRQWFVARRKYMIIVGFVFGAVITPGPDVLSQCSIAIPFVILYEVGIIGCRIFAPAHRQVKVGAGQAA